MCVYFRLGEREHLDGNLIVELNNIQRVYRFIFNERCEGNIRKCFDRSCKTRSFGVNYFSVRSRPIAGDRERLKDTFISLPLE